MAYTLTRQALILDLYAAFQCAKRHKTSRPYVQTFDRRLKRNIESLADDLLSRRYMPEPSSCFIVEHPKKREVFAAQFRDRVVHHLYYILLCAVVTAQATDWCVAGNMTDWGTGQRDMVETSNGIYSCTFSSLAGGNYEFKVKDKTTWGTAYPDQNYSFTLTEAKDVTIYFYETDHAIYVKLGNTWYSDARRWLIAGSHTNILNGSSTWANDDNSNAMNTTNGYEWSMSVSNKYLYKGTNYEYKICKNRTWEGKGNYSFSVETSGYYNIEYTFNEATEEYGVTTTPIDTSDDDKYIYVRKDGNVAPHLHVWDASQQITGSWPGIQTAATEVVGGVTFWKSGPLISGVDTSAGLGYIVSDSGNNQTEDLWLGHKTDYLIYKSSEATQANRVIFIPRLWGIPDWDYGTLLVPNGESENEFILEGQEISAWYEFGILIGNQFYGCTSTSERLEVVSPAGYNLDLGAYGNENQVKNFVLRNSNKCDISVNTSTNKLSLVSKLELPYFTEFGESVNYDNETFTMTTSSTWNGISLDIIGATSGQVKGDFLVVKKTETNQELYVYVKYTDNNESQKHFTDPKITTCALTLDPTKNIKEVQLKNPAAGTITFTDLYVTSSKQSVTLNSDGTNGWATFAAASPVSFANQDDVQVNIVTKEGSVLRKEKVASKEVPAGSAVLLYYEGLTSGTSVNVPVLNAAAAALDEKNVLRSSGAEGLEVTEAKHYYILGNGTSGVGFYPVQTKTKIAAYKGYIEFDTIGTAPKFLWFDEETTAIDALNNESETPNDGAVYDLSGRKVNGQLHRGIYVQNGKKFIVK